MSIRYTFSFYWKLVLLAKVAGCAVLGNSSSYQNTLVPMSVPSSAPDVQNENGDNQIVPASLFVSRVPEADDPADREAATPTVPGTITQLPSTTDPSCLNLGQCSASASSVTIYYWPSEAPDTYCLATLPDLPEPTLPPGLTPISPSIYAVFLSLTASDGCNQIRSSDRFTASFAPDEVSTITDSSGNVAANDFGNAPCGPPGSNINRQPYQPWFNVPQALFEQFGESESSYCVMPEVRDPSSTLINIRGPINGPVLPNKAKFHRHRRAERETRTGATVGVQSVYHGPTSQRHPPQYMTAAATAHGVPQPPARTPSR